MCNPALIITGVQMAFSAYGAHKDAQAEKQALKYEEQQQRNNAKVAENNRLLAEQQAADTKRRGDVEAQNHLKQVAALKSTQQSKMAANGLSLNEGSPLSLLEDTDFQGGYDANTIRSNAARDAWGQQIQGMTYQSQANDLKSSAQFSKMKGKQIKPGMAALTAAGTTAANKWDSIDVGFGQAKTSYNNWQADRTIQKQIKFQGG